MLTLLLSREPWAPRRCCPGTLSLPCWVTKWCLNWMRRARKLKCKPDIKAINDLKGKQVSAGSVGTSLRSFVRACLKWGGLVPDKEVTLIDVPPAGGILAAMEKGEVAATYAFGTVKAQLLRKGANVLLEVMRPLQGSPLMSA